MQEYTNTYPNISTKELIQINIQHGQWYRETKDPAALAAVNMTGAELTRRNA